MWRSDCFHCLETGKAALASDAFDVALVDFRLGPDSGLQLVREFERKAGGTPIIMMSGDADIQTEDTALGLGAYDFLSKDSLDTRTLRRAVNHVYTAHAIEAALRRSAEMAHSSNEAKSSFLACMSHDLRTPLNAIIGFSDALLMAPEGAIREEVVREYCGYMNQSGKHLLEIINTILDLSKIEQQEFELHREWIDLPELIDLQMAVLRPMAAEKDVSLTSIFRHGDELLLADGRALRQMLTNLLSNAIKFNRPGKAVIVSTALIDSGLEIRVSDEGLGMTSAELKMAMMPFGQVTGDPKLARQGTGLGLTIARSLMEQHGGELTLESCKEMGTSARMLFPSSYVSNTKERASG
jgi:signal transduction histidine kinase